MTPRGTSAGLFFPCAPNPNLSLPATVLAGLEANLTGMNRINELPDAQRESVMEAVRADLRLKAEFCRNHPDGNGRPGGFERPNMAGR